MEEDVNGRRSGAFQPGPKAGLLISKIIPVRGELAGLELIYKKFLIAWVLLIAYGANGNNDVEGDSINYKIGEFKLILYFRFK